MQTPNRYRDLFKDAKLRDFFQTTPWVLNGAIQDKQALQRCLENEATRLASQPQNIKFSLISPLYSTDPVHLRELAWSCLLQTYANWEIILYDDGSPSRAHVPVAEEFAKLDSRIKFIDGNANGGISAARNAAIEHATGDFVCVMDHDDLLHPQTLGIFARILQSEPETNFLFCNEVKISNDTSTLSDFYSKPGFSYATLLRTNYICHFTAVRKDLLLKAKTPSGKFFISEYDGFEDHNLFIRLAEQPGFTPRHTPIFGYYWRKALTSTAAEIGVKPDIWRRGRAMLLEHFKNQPADIAVTTERGPNGLHSIYFQQPKAAKIAVIVPYKDRADLTILCLEKLEQQETAAPLSVVLVDNNSSESKTNETITKWTIGSRRHNYALTAHSGPFNYSAINNAAVASHCADADFLLFLNNDVEITSKNAVSTMAAEMMLNQKIGICGMRLNYPDGRGLQHGGMGLRQTPSRLLAPCHLDNQSQFIYDEHRVFAVTFACAMVRKSAFDQVQGFDDVSFANGLSDVDLCCRITKMGHEVFYFGTLVGTHHESASRSHQVEDFEIQVLNERYPEILQAAFIRTYGYNLIVPSDSNDAWFETPLRYRIADKLNNAIKQLLGPFHKRLRKSLVRA